MPTHEGPASLEAPHSSQGPRGWAEGVPRAQPAFPVTSLCTDATHRILMGCLSDTHQSDARMVAPRELLSAGKQVTGLLPRGHTCHLPSRLLPAPGTCLALRGVGTPSCPPGRGLLQSVLASTHLLCFFRRVSSCGAHKEPHCSPGPGDSPSPDAHPRPSPLAERRPVTGPEGSACSRGPPARGSGVAVSKRQGTCLTTPPAAHAPTAAALGWLPGCSPGWPSMCGRCPCEPEGRHPTLHVGEERGGPVAPLSRGAAYPRSRDGPTGTCGVVPACPDWGSGRLPTVVSSSECRQAAGTCGPEWLRVGRP